MTEYMQNILAWGFGWQEGLIILVILLIVFGGQKLPELARSIGKSLTEFKKGFHEAEEVKDDLEKDVKKIKDDIVNEAKDAAGLKEEDYTD